MPVYNGARYLGPVIGSHLRQTFADFELIITDDASTDDTQAICERFAATDSRIRYVRIPTNGGATHNFNRAFNLARGEYFKWSAQDDFLAPEFLEKCVQLLDRQPDAVLCHCLCKIVHLADRGAGEIHAETLPVLERYDPGRKRTGADRLSVRFGARITGGRCTELFGVIRREALGRVNRTGAQGRPREGQFTDAAPFQPFVGADRALLAELAIEGRFACVGEYLFYNGHHSGRGSARGRSPLERLAFYRPVRQGSRSFPIRSLFAAYIDMVRRRVPAGGERLRCYGHMVRALFTRMNAARLMFELVNGFAPGLGQTIARGYQMVRPAKARDRVLDAEPAADMPAANAVISGPRGSASKVGRGD